MARTAPPKALFFDVFGTCVDWRSPVTRTLHQQAHEKLNSATASLATTVRLKATNITVEEWGTFAQQWRDSYKEFVRAISQDPSIPWKSVDQHHYDYLVELVSIWGIEGLWTDEELRRLSLVWHYLDPWSDSSAGIAKLSEGTQTATLSNGNLDLLNDLKDHARLPFTHILSAEMFESYKPSPKVYLGAVDRLGLEPSECAMVAAHLNDLKASKSCGLQTIYVGRPREEDWSESEVEKARIEGWVDIWVQDGAGGFLAVAKELGFE